MIFDVQVFTAAEESYVYSMESGILFRSTPLLNQLFEDYHLGTKEVVKKLRNIYPVQMIAQGMADIEGLEKNQIIDLKVVQYLTNDHANLVALQQVHLEESTDEARQSLENLLAKYHLRADEVELVPIGDCLQPESSLGREAMDSLERLEWFLEMWGRPCRRPVQTLEGNQVLQAVQSVESNLAEAVNSVSQRIANGKLSSLAKFFRQVYKQEKKLFCCRAGLDYLIIGKDGQYYHCSEALRCGQSKDFERLGQLASVCDFPACQKCFARYFCGGPCPVRKDSLSPTDCELFRQVCRLMLIISLQLNENNSELAEKIALDCMRAG